MRLKSKTMLWLTTGVMAEDGYGIRILAARKSIAMSLPDYKHHLVNFENFSNYKYKDKFINKHGNKFEKIYSYRALPNRNVLLLLLNYLFFAVVLAFVILRNKPSYIYCHGLRAVFPAFILPFINAKKVVLDMHGIPAEELVMAGIYRTNSIFFRFDKCIERYGVRKSGKIIVVSNKMKDYLFKQYGRDENIFLMPCCYQEDKFYFSHLERNRIRDEYGWSNSVVFVYSGSFAVWQNLPNVLRLFKQYLIYDKGARLLVLSMDNKNILDKEVDKLGLPAQNIVYKSLKQEDVFRYLSAADFGILFREKNLVNDVSSPTKYAEYLACGLPVIISEGVGDYSDVTKSNSLGLLMVDESFAKDKFELLKELKTEDSKNRCILYAKSELSRNTFTEKYLQIFSD